MNNVDVVNECFIYKETINVYLEKTCINIEYVNLLVFPKHLTLTNSIQFIEFGVFLKLVSKCMQYGNATEYRLYVGFNKTKDKHISNI